MKATSSLTRMNKDRIALNIVTDNMQSLVFLTRIVMAHMFDYRDANKDEMKEAIDQMQR